MLNLVQLLNHFEKVWVLAGQALSPVVAQKVAERLGCLLVCGSVLTVGIVLEDAVLGVVIVAGVGRRAEPEGLGVLDLASLQLDDGLQDELSFVNLVQQADAGLIVVAAALTQVIDGRSCQPLEAFRPNEATKGHVLVNLKV